MSVNRKYKNTVFTKLFSDNATLLELYNALSGANYDANTVIEINTLEDVLYMDLLNDVSFTIDDKIVILIEHQASISENLPLRFLLYIARVYEKIIDKKSVYRQKLIKIPTPEFIVLYNGKATFPEKKELRLSDAFMDFPNHSEKYGSLDLTVRVLNINEGHNIEYVRKSETLHGYVTFTKKVRDGVESGLELSAAVADAVKYCEDNNILESFLTKHASEVENMLMTEFNLEDAKAVWREEGWEDGREAGVEEGREIGVEEGMVATYYEFEQMIKEGMSAEEMLHAINERLTLRDETRFGGGEYIND